MSLSHYAASLFSIHHSPLELAGFHTLRNNFAPLPFSIHICRQSTNIQTFFFQPRVHLLFFFLYLQMIVDTQFKQQQNTYIQSIRSPTCRCRDVIFIVTSVLFLYPCGMSANMAKSLKNFYFFLRRELSLPKKFLKKNLKKKQNKTKRSPSTYFFSLNN